jgi:hypothetical protein
MTTLRAYADRIKQSNAVTIRDRFVCARPRAGEHVSLYRSAGGCDRETTFDPFSQRTRPPLADLKRDTQVSLSLPPLEFCLATSPIQAEKSLPDRNALGSPDYGCGKPRRPPRF